MATRFDTFTITVTGIHPRTALGRLSDEAVTLPVSIREILGLGPLTSARPLDEVGCRRDLLSIDGTPIGIRLDAVATNELRRGQSVDVGLCRTEDEIMLGSGPHRLAGLPSDLPLTVDRVVLAEEDVWRRDSGTMTQNLTPRRSSTERTVEVPPCTSSCWVILGEGHNAAWHASLDGVPLGPSYRVSGGFNGWLLEPSDLPRNMVMTWSAQRAVSISLFASQVAVLICAIAASPLLRRHRAACAPAAAQISPATWQPLERRRAAAAAGFGALSTALVVTPVALLAYLPIAVVIVLTRRPRIAGIVAAVSLTMLGFAISVTQARSDFAANSDWPFRFDHFHRYGLSALILLTVGVLADLRRFRAR